jgi:membrane-bound serine protease (ClpP class)
MVLILFIVLAFFTPWPWTIAVLAAGVVAEIGEVVWGRRLARRWKAKTGVETIIGTTAEVTAACEPAGQVRVHGELWEAVCRNGGARVGDTVRITALDELTLIVTPLSAAGAQDAPHQLAQ